MMRTVLMQLKRVVRRFIPDRVMARIRRSEHSRAVRRNVDLYVVDPVSARRWVKLTPDTYRVISTVPTESVSGVDVVTAGPPDTELARYLGWHGSDVVVRGSVGRPGMRGMRVVEPPIVPITAVTSPRIADTLPPEAAESPASMLAIASAAGLRIGVIPEVVADLSLPITQIAGAHVVIFAAVPLHDIGGGSRAAQIAIELLRRGYGVTYVYRYPTVESGDLGLRFIHPDLAEVDVAVFEPGLIRRANGDAIVIVEAPIAEFVSPVERLASEGWTVVYDVIDDWTDVALGGDWYRRDAEQRLVDASTGITCSADDLTAHIATFGREAVVVPNAVNESIFGVAEPQSRPSDLPAGSVLGYHGSLYGEWFDWRALESVAEAFPDHVVAVIGDARGVPKVSADNIVFLGLKRQSELPAYLQSFEVGLVPFEVSNLTHTVSPLKIYEYLASGVPVAAPPLRPLRGLDGVYLDPHLPTAVAKAIEGGPPDRNVALRDHTWGARLAIMFRHIDRQLQPIDNDGVTTAVRLPVRYGKAERWIRA